LTARRRRNPQARTPAPQSSPHYPLATFLGHQPLFQNIPYRGTHECTTLEWECNTKDSTLSAPTRFFCLAGEFKVQGSMFNSKALFFLPADSTCFKLILMAAEFAAAELERTTTLNYVG
jgi:hypothetical protein